MVEEAEFHDYRRANDTKVDGLRGEFLTHTAEERSRDAIMLEQIKTLTAQVQVLILMWEQAKGAITFIKIMSVVAATCAAAWTFLSTNVHWK